MGLLDAIIVSAFAGTSNAGTLNGIAEDAPFVFIVLVSFVLLALFAMGSIGEGFGCLTGWLDDLFSSGSSGSRHTPTGHITRSTETYHPPARHVSLPPVIIPTESAEFYDREAERHRALGRMLAAEAEHNNQIVTAALAAERRKDLDAAVAHEQRKRGLRSRLPKE